MCQRAQICCVTKKKKKKKETEVYSRENLYLNIIAGNLIVKNIPIFLEKNI